jgi:hypothetical protein
MGVGAMKGPVALFFAGEPCTAPGFPKIGKERLFAGKGRCAGRAAALPERGDCPRMPVAGEPVIVRPARSGRMRSMPNAAEPPPPAHGHAETVMEHDRLPVWHQGTTGGTADLIPIASPAGLPACRGHRIVRNDALALALAHPAQGICAGLPIPGPPGQLEGGTSALCSKAGGGSPGIRGGGD